jgi:hypothetical protein
MSYNFDTFYKTGWFFKEIFPSKTLSKFHGKKWSSLPLTFLVQPWLIKSQKHNDPFLKGGCSVLYSEDLQDGQRVMGVTIKNPF